MSRRGLAPAGQALDQVAPLVQAEVESVDLVPGTAQERDKDGSDVAAIARNQHFQDPHHRPEPAGALRPAGMA
jgi:hypothetical protein